MLRAICDHGSDISDLSDDDERDDAFSLDDASVQSNTDESSVSAASEADDSDDEPLSSLTHQAASRWKQTRSFNPVVANIPQTDDVRDRSNWAPRRHSVHVMHFISSYQDVLATWTSNTTGVWHDDA